MNILIVGCGRVGTRLSTTLDRMGHHVSVVDTRASAFNYLDSEFSGLAIVGTGIDEDILRSAGVEQTDMFFAVTNADNTNLMAAQIAKSVFHIRDVTARVYDPVRAEIFMAMGIKTICPTITITDMFLSQITKNEVE